MSLIEKIAKIYPDWQKVKLTRAGYSVQRQEAVIALADALGDPDAVTRFEVIDHRQCVWCRGRLTANYAQPDGSYKELPCDKCDGSGIRGGRVYTANSNPETSNIEIQLCYQDDGKTLKVFVKDSQS